MSNVEDWEDEAWNAVMGAQFDEIESVLGRDAAESANYGWGDASNADLISIATKVGDRVLLSEARRPNMQAVHSWRSA